MAERNIEESHIEPINILIIFLLGFAAALFILGTIKSFDLGEELKLILIVVTCILYAISLFAFLRPHKRKTPIEIEPEYIEREVERVVEVPVEKIVYKDKPVEKIVEKKVNEPFIVQKRDKKKSKYVGSNYNEKYHLRTCRFAGAIKDKYLVEENDSKYFKIRGYEACKVCKPDKN